MGVALRRDGPADGLRAAPRRRRRLPGADPGRPGGDSFHTTEDDVAEFLRRNSEAEVERVPGAGHSVQGDRPVELARTIAAFGWERQDEG
jgi:pimeloyl-ACP methyl ester carboxylesterase